MCPKTIGDIDVGAILIDNVQVILPEATIKKITSM